ncbi:U32 family peptidase [Orbaceae bacterium ac157xtp]
MISNKIELLSPAKNIEIGKQAILHGADAIYIGGPKFGARHNAGNSVADIANLVEFAHQYYAKVFVTLNTILHDDELELAQQLIHQLYNAGIDALIVQDMGILELDLPPIDLHASTQMDIRTPEKAKFLADVGFSQIVLARELDLKQISRISELTTANIEFFIHGALCVSYSGQCYLSYAQTGRSANRGECSQPCRLPYTLKDENGSIIAYQQHLLSLKDNNQYNNLDGLIDAGVRSFKIEGRYKDLDYVKNITAYYRQKLDAILTDRTDLQPASSGKVEHGFTPDPNRTFHRGSTDYFVNGRQSQIGAFDSPKFLGIAIGEITKITPQSVEVKTNHQLNNGDGLNVLIKREVVGFRAERVEKLNEQSYQLFVKELPKTMLTLALPITINRNADHAWQQILAKESATRRITVELTLTQIDGGIELSAKSEEGIKVSKQLLADFAIAEQVDKALNNIQDNLNKLGQTLYYAKSVAVNLTPMLFIPNGQLNQLRRDTIELLRQTRLANYSRKQRKPQVEPKPNFPQNQLTFSANVYNAKAQAFYQHHGVESIAQGYESNQVKDEVPLMTTKHCLRYTFNLCPKQNRGVQGVKNRATPLKLANEKEELTLTFNCKACEMQVWGKIKKQVLKKPLLGSEGIATKIIF